MQKPTAFFILCWIAVLTINTSTYAQEILRRPPSAIVDVAISPNNQLIARVFASGTVEVVEAVSGRVVFRQPAGLQLFSAQLDWSPDGSLLAAGVGTNVFIWQTNTWTLFQSLSAVGREPIADMDGYSIAESFNSMGWNPQGTLFFGLTESAWIYVWQVPDYILSFNQEFSTSVSSMTWLPNGTALTDGERTFDINTGLTSFQGRQYSAGCCLGVPTSIALSPNGTHFGIGDVVGNISIVNATTLETISVFPYLFGTEPVHAVYALAWDPHGEAILFTGSDVVQTLILSSSTVTPLAQIDGELFASDWGAMGNIATGGLSGNQAIFGVSALQRNMQTLNSSTNIELNFTVFAPDFNILSETTDFP